MRGYIRLINNLDSEKTITVCILLAIVVLAIDYITGKDIHFPIWFIFPSMIAAWKDKKIMAYTLAILLPIIRLSFLIPWHETETIYHAAIDVLITMAALTVIVYLVNKTSLQSMELQKKVKVLEGILPICASCKKIRNVEGEYESLEKYIGERSEAQFSHGICPECMKIWYSTFIENTEKKN